MGRDVVEDLGGKAASHAHLGDVFGGIQVDAHAASPEISDGGAAGHAGNRFAKWDYRTIAPRKQGFGGAPAKNWRGGGRAGGQPGA
ncbi:hypothetical protein D3C86_1866000 [compost metagenome]